MNSKIPFSNRDELYDLYVVQRLSQDEIGVKFGVHQMTVSNRLREYGVDRELVMMSRGYRLVKLPGHPRAHRDGTVKEHTVIAERLIGRFLEDGEEVHHIDLNKLNNVDSNLAVIMDSDHSRLHKYMGRLGAYVFFGGDRPAPLEFDQPVFWSGKWINSIDPAALFAAPAINKLIEGLVESAALPPVD